MDSACQHDGKMLPHANYERIPVQSTRSAVFGSMLVDDKSNTPYSDATQVRLKNHTSFVDFVSGGLSLPAALRRDARMTPTPSDTAKGLSLWI